MTNPIVRSAGILIGRVALGVIFLAHGLRSSSRTAGRDRRPGST